MERTDLIGTWRLVSFEMRDDAGNMTYPYGPDAIGYILYSADGYMAVEMMAAYRANFADADTLGGTDAERAQAAATYRSYCAQWEFLGDRVRHHFRTSLYPNRTGTTEERFIDYDGARLTLSTAPQRSGGTLRRNFLVWERVTNA